MKRAWNMRADMEWEQSEKSKQLKKKVKAENRKKDCLDKITKELEMDFAKSGGDFSIRNEDIQHQFTSVVFKKGCKICGDTKNVKENSYCGLKTCNDCSDDGIYCKICSWVHDNYDNCGNDCYGDYLIVPNRKPSRDYYNLENKPICRCCHGETPKENQRLGFFAK